MNNKLNIKGKNISVPIIQGGMGVGVSRWPLASSVAKEGGIGIISTAGLDRLVSRDVHKKVDTYEATFWEVSKAKKESNNGLIGVNIMYFLQQDRELAIRGAVDAGSDFIISGAGIPLELPTIKNPGSTALIPIVSSLRVLKIICNRWERANYRPDAIVLEGPLAGGHLGFKFEEINNPENELEKIFLPIKDFAQKNGDFPVIVAGGIHDRNDIKKFIDLGADGVQIGSRFLVTNESSASEKYKLAIVNSQKEDIIVTTNSPCGFPFRLVRESPVYQDLINGQAKNNCDKGYLLQKDEEGKSTKCFAKTNTRDYFCICNGLMNSAGYSIGKDLYTVGANGYKIQKITSVRELMNELKGID